MYNLSALTGFSPICTGLRHVLDFLLFLAYMRGMGRFDFPFNFRSPWLAALAAAAAILAATPYTAGDACVRVVSPVAGQLFAPGDTVEFVVETAPPLWAVDGGIGISGFGEIRGRGIPGQRFTAEFVLPEAFAGPLTFRPLVVLGQRTEDGITCLRAPDAKGANDCVQVFEPEVTIRVRPRTPPRQLTADQPSCFLGPPPGTTHQLYAKGRYKGGIERDLTSSAAGTFYLSSDPAVIAVDREGACSVTGTGIAVVTIDNGGVRDFINFQVENPAHPLAPIDLGGQVRVRRGALRLETNPRIVRSHTQRLTVTNISALPLGGPLFLEISGLPAGVSDRNSNGGGRHWIELPGPAFRLPPGRNVTVDIDFLNRGSAPITYTAKIFHGEM
jgi:hypothetical protein